MRIKISRALFSLIALAALAIVSHAGAGHAHASQRRKPVARQKKAAVVYSCPMDPDVKSHKPGKCPKCGMALRPVKHAPADPAQYGTDGPARVGETNNEGATTSATPAPKPVAGTIETIAPNTLKI